MTLVKPANTDQIDGFTVTFVPADAVPPTVAITGVPANANEPFTATFTFSEDVVGFGDPGDIVTTNATQGQRTPVSPSVYTAVITPTGTGPVTVQVPAGAVQDLAGNDNVASTVATTQFTTPQDVAQEVISDFTGSRMGQVTANRPQTSRRIDRLNGSAGGGETLSALGFSTPNPARFAMAFQGNEVSFAARSDRLFPMVNALAAGDGLDVVDEYESAARWSIWTEGRVTLFDDDTSDNGRFSIVHAGLDYLATPDILVGLSAQVDWMSQDNAASAGGVTGMGWMAGPSVTARIDDGFYIDASVSAGQSSNEINPLGTYTDDYTTTRFLASAGLVGDFAFGAYSIEPSIEFIYMLEHQHAYTDSNNVRVGAQTFRQGEVRVGPRFTRTFDLTGGDALSLFVDFEGIYTIADEGDYAAGSLAHDSVGLTGEAGLGGTYTLSGGMAISLSGSYAGIGTETNVYSGTVRIALPLN